MSLARAARFAVFRAPTRKPLPLSSLMRASAAVVFPLFFSPVTWMRNGCPFTAPECTLALRRMRSERPEDEMSYDIEITAGGKSVELNEFAERVVCNTLLGLVSSLRDVDIRQEIRIVLKPSAG
jgi:hypothetical protein